MGKIARIAKVSRKKAIAAAHGRPKTRPVFIFGTQRSGTRIPLVVADRSPDIMPYAEGAEGFYQNVLLADFATVERSLESSAFPAVMLKPICDSHRADEILERFPASRALWIFRDFRDTVNSATVKWPTAPEGIKLLAEGATKAAGWWAGGLTADDFELVRQHYRPNMEPQEAHALLWYLRNTFYFRLGLEEREDVLLIKYEDLVKEPLSRFGQVFSFIDMPFRERFVADVHSSSVGGGPRLEFAKGIDALCSEVYERLNASYASQDPASQEVI